MDEKNRTQSPFKGILWDKDGTLVDSFGAWVRFERVLARELAGQFLSAGREREYEASVLGALGVTPEGRVSTQGLLATGTEPVLLEAFWQTLRSLDPGLDSREAFLAAARHHMEDLRDKHLAVPPPFPGTVAALEKFQTWGLVQGLATADSEANARRDLRAAGLDGYLSFWACGGLRSKPDPWAVLEFAAQSGLAPGEVLVVGDTPADAAMARAAGAGFVAVLCGTGRAEDFPEGTQTVADPADLAHRWPRLL